MNRQRIICRISLVLIALLVSCATAPKSIVKEPAVQTIISENAPWIGLTGRDNVNGVQVVDIYMNSPAQAAGIKGDDIIIGFEGQKIVSTPDLLSMLEQKKANDRVNPVRDRSSQRDDRDSIINSNYTLAKEHISNSSNESKNISNRVKIKIIREEEKAELITAPHTNISTEELTRKYQEFISKANPSDKMSFKVVKRLETKELDVILGSLPRVFRSTPHTNALVWGSITPPKPEPIVKKKTGFLGISMDVANNLEMFGLEKGSGGIKITSVSPSSPADKGGLKLNDILIQYDDRTFSGDESTYREKITDYIKEKGSGADIVLKIFRLTDNVKVTAANKETPSDAVKVMEMVKKLKVGEEISVSTIKEVKHLELKITLGTRTTSAEKSDIEPEQNDTIHPEMANYSITIEELAKKVISDTGITDKYNDLIKRYNDDEKWDDGFRLRDIRYLHRDPFKIPRICDDFIAELNNGITQPIRELNPVVKNGSFLDIIIAKLGEKITDEDIAPVQLKTGISLEEHCRQLEELLQLSDKYRKEAFAGLTENDYSFLEGNLIPLTDRWLRDGNFSESDEIKNRNSIDKRTIQLTDYVDYRKLFASAKILCSILSQDYLDGLKADIEDAGDKKGILFSKDTPLGKIIIGGKGNDRYESPAAIIIDVGGNDFYANNSAGSIPPKQPFSIIIDYAGNDRYYSYANVCQGAGMMGAGILVDIEGDDTYIAQNWAQGSGLLGVGILVDVTGNDSYKGQEFVQGCGLFGIGVLIDLAEPEPDKSLYDINAADKYQANGYAQGFAGPKAVGFLFDAYGNDTYYATGKRPNGYPENVGTFDGWAQGCGTGFRAYSDASMSRSGGVGILIDNDGKDYFEAGTFSQGGGYFFGWGMLHNGGDDNDYYLGTRYAQGFAAHSAIGYFIDEGGDDTYTTMFSVTSGLSWDLTCVVFIDKGGDDTYDGGSFSLGASAHNGFCLFMDLGGKDTYKGEVAKAGANTYHGGYSLSIFLDESSPCTQRLDEGEEEDIYTNRTNNTIEVNKEYSIFIDTDKKIEELLIDNAYTKILKNNIKE